MSHSVKFEYNESYAELLIWDDGKTATLSILYSKFRKRGAARRALEYAIQYCDLMKYDMVLEVVPFGEGAKMGSADLKAFYMTFGFVLQGDNVMFRSAKDITTTQASAE